MQTRHNSPGSRPSGQPPVRSASVAKQIFAPMVAALAIDLLDFATFGPVGLYTGLIVGAVAGYWLAPVLGFPPHRRWLSALATGVYCTLPLTGLIPLATLASVMSRSLLRDSLRVDASSETDPEGAIDVEYEVLSDESNPRRDDGAKGDSTINDSKGDDSF